MNLVTTIHLMCNGKVLLLFLGLGIVVSGCATYQTTAPRANDDAETVSVAPYTPGNKTPYEVFGEVYEVMPDSFGYLEIGVASWYGKKFHGKPTSNGERYDMYKLSAAHKSLPIPSMVKVTNLDNGKHVILRVNDRGPFHDNRLIDLSYAAAKAIGYADDGIAPVVVEAVDELNHPERYAALHQAQGIQYYLQVGAFSELRWANHLKERVTELIRDEGPDIGLKILQSERDEKILHKVWLGPMSDETQRQRIASLVEAANLGKPINVEVE
jgi:rare lipoprotein A